MADDLTKRGAADRSRINMNEDYEVVYWTMRFSVSRDQLKRGSRRLARWSKTFSGSWDGDLS
jgi:uncharacterized protein DUF3606